MSVAPSSARPARHSSRTRRPRAVGWPRLRRLQRRYGGLWPMISGLVSLLVLFFAGVYGYMAVEG